MRIPSLKALRSWLWNTVTTETTDHVSDNCIWTTRLRTTRRTICGIPTWTIQERRIPCKYGEPYIAAV